MNQPKFWRISDRAFRNGQPSSADRGPVTYWVADASAGLKHFGARRLGRSGLSHRPPLVSAPPETDNVWDIDCSSFFPANAGGGVSHGAYFVTDATIELMRQILRGIDRGVFARTLLSQIGEST
jgi:hypothetical protein